MLKSLKLFSKNKKSQVALISVPKDEYKFPDTVLNYIDDCSPTPTKTIGRKKSYNEVGSMQLVSVINP